VSALETRLNASWHVSVHTVARKFQAKNAIKIRTDKPKAPNFEWHCEVSGIQNVAPIKASRAGVHS
jgi:hypothetical protein